jgi:type IV secretory pathway TrbL component
LDVKMFYRLPAAFLFVLAFVVAPAAAQQNAPSTEKQETNCTTSSAATAGSATEKTSNSMAVEKSAVLPDAGGSNSAAPTVQSGGKPLEVRSECPPDSKPK